MRLLTPDIIADGDGVGEDAACAAISSPSVVKSYVTTPRRFIARDYATPAARKIDASYARCADVGYAMLRFGY